MTISDVEPTTKDSSNPSLVLFVLKISLLANSTSKSDNDAPLGIKKKPSTTVPVTTSRVSFAVLLPWLTPLISPS